MVNTKPRLLTGARSGVAHDLSRIVNCGSQRIGKAGRKRPYVGDGVHLCEAGACGEQQHETASELVEFHFRELLLWNLWIVRVGDLPQTSGFVLGQEPDEDLAAVGMLQKHARRPGDKTFRKS
jgi:hypothetical protein